MLYKEYQERFLANLLGVEEFYVVRGLAFKADEKRRTRTSKGK